MPLAAARWATLYVEESYSTSSRKMGRQAAGEGLLDALIQTESSSRFTLVASRGTSLESLRNRLRASRPNLALHLWPLDKLDRMSSVDSFYVADPLLARWAWRRQWSSDRAFAYSLIGVTHTLCSQSVGEGLRDCLTAPLEAWDALICTSQAARSAVQAILEHEYHRLSHRLGAICRPPLPQLPVIPLGCRTQQFSILPSRRHKARQTFQFTDQHLVALFVGRLELHGKAHPGVMLQALARFNAVRAQSHSTQRAVLLVYGTAQSDAVYQAWLQLQSCFAPHLEIKLLNGFDLEQGSLAWAAADVFITMADSLQETFGLTPVEAMAAGLPVIASDWDGYRDTVVHGSTGFLIPTTQPPAGRGLQLQADLMLGRIDYDSYLCQLMQQVVVDEDALLQSLLLLGDDPDLRQRMSRSGRARAQQLYDWTAIAKQYRELASQLTATRLKARASESSTLSSPLPCPWQTFSQWATRSYPSTGHLRCPDPERLRLRVRQSRELSAYTFPSHLMAPSAHVDAVVEAVLSGDTTMVSLALHPALRRASLFERELAVAWLTKIGALVWES